MVTYDGGISCESVSNSPEKEIDVEKNLSAGKLHEGLFSLHFLHCLTSSFSKEKNLIG